jgi:hypothetical protein
MLDDWTRLGRPTMKKKTAADTALGLAMAALAAGWIVSMVWTARQPDWLRAAQAIFFLVATSAVGATMNARADARLDEVELAAARFGARWGLVAGVASLNLLIFLPPFQSLLTDFAGTLRGFPNGFPRAVEGRMFMLGIVSTFVAQEAFRSLLAAGWKWSKR